MKKSIFIIPSTILLSTLAMTFTNSEVAFGHGYVNSPPSRSYNGSLERNLSLYGTVVYEPQSLEAPKGFPQTGPSDGQIASAGGLFGGLLDKQSSTMWKKGDISTGSNTFKWTYTANHRTSKWHYYMTKQGWNPDQPLKRDSLEPIGEVKHDGSMSSNNLNHTIDVPNNRSGYHVILAVWDVADTSNAFYQVIDVNVNGKGGNGSSDNNNNNTGNSNTNDNNNSSTDSNNNNNNNSNSSNGSNEHEHEHEQEGDVGLGETDDTEDSNNNNPKDSNTASDEWKIGSHSNPVQYVAGETVTCNNKKYTVLQTHYNYGDPNWSPEIARSLFSPQGSNTNNEQGFVMRAYQAVCGLFGR